MHRKAVLNFFEKRSVIPIFQILSHGEAIREQPRQKGGCAHEAHNSGSYGDTAFGGDDGDRCSRLCAGEEGRYKEGRHKEGREEGREESPAERWHPRQSCCSELGCWRPARRRGAGGRKG